MSLESGPYFISSVSFTTGEPVSRFVGPSRGPEDAIVVLPLGSPPFLWRIERLPNGTYTLTLGDRSAEVVNGSLKLTHPSVSPFEWTILRGAPSPPPIGRDSFGIIVPNQRPQESWFIESTEGDQAVEVPVTIGDVASSIVIVSPLRE